MYFLQFLDPSTPVADLVRALLPDSINLQLDHVLVAPDQLTLIVISTQAEVACPLCGQPTRRVQSRYARTLADLPWAGMHVQLHLHVRRFFCLNATCPRQIFTERLPDLVVPYARRTNRLHDQLLTIGFALGGEAGARQSASQCISVSPDTLLALLRRHASSASPTPHVLGVDDWSFRRPKRMGTILVDLERHVPIDLLPESSEEAFAAWLRAHPGIEIISCDHGARARLRVRSIVSSKSSARCMVVQTSTCCGNECCTVLVPDQQKLGRTLSTGSRTQGWRKAGEASADAQQ